MTTRRSRGPTRRPVATGSGSASGAAAEAGSVASFLERLRPAEVADVPEEWREHTTPDTPYPGECFFRSLDYIQKQARDRSDLWLVHGEYQVIARHAWVELPGDLVFDGVLQRFYHRPDYYRLHFASPWYKYGPWAAVLMYISLPPNENGLVQLGDWHDLLKLPWADPNNPTLIDTDRMRELLASSGLRPDLADRGRRKKRTHRRPTRG